MSHCIFLVAGNRRTRRVVCETAPNGGVVGSWRNALMEALLWHHDKLLRINQFCSESILQ